MCMLDCLLVSAIIFYMYKAKIWMGVVTSLQIFCNNWWVQVNVFPCFVAVFRWNIGNLAWKKLHICAVYLIVCKLLQLSLLEVSFFSSWRHTLLYKGTHPLLGIVAMLSECMVLGLVRLSLYLSNWYLATLTAPQMCPTLSTRCLMAIHQISQHLSVCLHALATVPLMMTWHWMMLLHQTRKHLRWAKPRQKSHISHASQQVQVDR